MMRRIAKPANPEEWPRWVSPAMDWMDGRVLTVIPSGRDFYRVPHHLNADVWPPGAPIYDWSVHHTWTTAAGLTPAAVPAVPALILEVL